MLSMTDWRILATGKGDDNGMIVRESGHSRELPA
jgi:hypothetical protein